MQQLGGQVFLVQIRQPADVGGALGIVSPERGDVVPDREDRQAEIMELQQEIAFDKAEDMIGREVLVMIEGKVADENAYVGRTYRDAPNVDGLIFINTNEELLSGDFARVKVTGALDYDLIGELL